MFGSKVRQISMLAFCISPMVVLAGEGDNDAVMSSEPVSFLVCPAIFGTYESLDGSERLWITIARYSGLPYYQFGEDRYFVDNQDHIKADDVQYKGTCIGRKVIVETEAWADVKFIQKKIEWSGSAQNGVDAVRKIFHLDRGGEVTTTEFVRVK